MLRYLRASQVYHHSQLLLVRQRIDGYRHASHLANQKTNNVKNLSSDLPKRLVKEEPTVNEVGIQYLSKDLRDQLYPSQKTALRKRLTKHDKIKINLSQQYLEKFGLMNKKTNITDPITLNVPQIQGKTLNEHFIRLALNDASPYLKFAQVLSKIELPPKPQKWLFEPGWYRYEPNNAKPTKVPYPLEDILVFDVETMYKVSEYPVMATCASPVAWYGWVSPYLTATEKNSVDNNHLIPMDVMNKSKLIVGHNVCYDRARIKDEYSFKKSKAFYLDTLSLHVAATGICSRQRPVWMKFNNNQKMESKLSKEINKLYDENHFYDYLLNDQLSMLGNENLSNKFDEEDHQVDNPWVSMTSTNSLADVYHLHCGTTLDKADRDYFKSIDKTVIVERFQQLMNYCAGDVQATHEVFRKVFPKFCKTCPHPVSFSALRHINSIFLPTSYQTWQNYIQNAESLYQNNKMEIEKSLAEIALELVNKFKESSEEVVNDPWYSQLNWEIKPVKMTKDGKPYKRQKLPGYPEWYRSLFPSMNSEIKLTIRTRLVPILMKLKWEDCPLIWTETKGWCFRLKSNNFTRINELVKKNYTRIQDFTEDPNFEELTKDYKYVYFKVPHPNGPGNRTTSLTTKSFLQHFEKGILTSEYDLAEKVLDLNASASYWISSRERIMSQFVVYEDSNSKMDFNLPLFSNGTPDDQIGIIIPQILPMGTITRRAVERTWLTASNVKKNRIGSELKTKVQAPDGYCFVGADVDSEELWIASLLSDSIFKIHGGSAIGWMTLEGNKLEKTDLHSKTAEILGISRNEAKVFNYSRIYGAGLKHTSTLLKQFNPSLTDAEVIKICNNLFDSTKGKTVKLGPKEKKFFQSRSINLNKIWYGGSESVLFNKLENLAENKIPKTPVLKAGITEALKKENLNSNSFLPSRINWAIQSSGVDYLHLLIVSMEYLIEMFNVDARLCITVHDEIRYLVKEEDKYKVSLLLQIANLWTRGIFCEQLGIQNIPQSCAFFSQIDIDKILRKEVDTPCETPSNKNVNIPNGETLDIVQLLKKFKSDAGGDDVAFLNLGKKMNLNKIRTDDVVALLNDNGEQKANEEIVLSSVKTKVDAKINIKAQSSGAGPDKLTDDQETMFINMQIEQDTAKVKQLMKKIMGTR